MKRQSGLKAACACGTKAYASQREAEIALDKVQRLGLRPEMPTRVIECPFEQWHLAGAATVAGTGPDRSTRSLVLERDDYRCFCCGTPIIGRDYSLQHRDSRGMGGSKNPLKNSPANLITLLGSATTECHVRVEGRHTADNVAGYWLKTGQVPADTPVLHWRLGPVLLGHDGSVEPVGRAAA